MKASVIYKVVGCIAFIVLLFGGVSCSEDAGGNSMEAGRFVERNAPGLVKGKSYKLLYDELSWQTVRNRQRKTFCMQRDNQTAYIHVKISSVSMSGLQNNHTVNAVISYKTDKNASETVESLEMTVLKSDDMMVWLWNEECKTGVIIPL